MAKKKSVLDELREVGYGVRRVAIWFTSSRLALSSENYRDEIWRNTIGTIATHAWQQQEQFNRFREHFVLGRCEMTRQHTEQHQATCGTKVCASLHNAVLDHVVAGAGLMHGMQGWAEPVNA